MIAADAPGLLRVYADAGVLEPADVHVARTLGRLAGESDDLVLLAVALAVRAVREGSVCLDLGSPVEGEDGMALDLPFPFETSAARSSRGSPSDLAARVARSPLLGGDSAPLHLDGDLLYLDRYWRYERLVAGIVDERRGRADVELDEGVLASSLAGITDPLQRDAVETAARRWLAIVAGGPGTGKTTVVAKLLDALEAQDDRLRVALVAPTGKAAARLQEAVGREATTVHRRLGWRPGARTRFLHDRDHPLPYDVVVLDEASMVSLTLMARLLDAVPDTARLVLVGDPGQLASVDAGAVLADLINRDGDPGDGREGGRDVVTLRTVHRTDNAEITSLAAAIAAGDPDEVVRLLGSGETVRLVAADDPGIVAEVRATGAALFAAALAGDAAAALGALNGHRVLCAHLDGPSGVAAWSRRVEQVLAADGHDLQGGWYVGRPVLVTANDQLLGLFNGDTGVVVLRDGHSQVAFPGADGTVRLLATNRLGEVATVHAMSVHKSQGSEFDAVTLVLPEVGSPLLTRELLYTAVTRAKRRVRVVASEEAVRTAVARRTHRASGLARA